MLTVLIHHRQHTCRYIHIYICVCVAIDIYCARMRTDLTKHHNFYYLDEQIFNLE